MGDQRVDERAVGVAGGGMDDKSRGLLDDDQVLVFVDHVEGNILPAGLAVLVGGTGTS